MNSRPVKATLPPFYINVNGREKRIDRATVTYDEIVALRFEPQPAPVGDHLLVTVTYRGGPERNPVGSLTPGQSVHVMNAMFFCAQVTSGA